MERERILITGAGGRVGPHILPRLRPRYSLRLLDQNPIASAADDEPVVADIREAGAVESACAGVKAVVHLAAISDEDDFLTRLLPVNVEGTYTVFEAARRAGVGKIIFVSTGQTVLHHGRGVWITPETPARPWTVYACTKLFGEALARYYSDHHGLSVICLRLGWFQPPDSPAWAAGLTHPREWCSPRDFAQLVRKAIESDLRFGIFFGVSNNAGRYWDLTSAEQLLDYRPEDDSARLMASLRPSF